MNLPHAHIIHRTGGYAVNRTARLAAAALLAMQWSSPASAACALAKTITVPPNPGTETKSKHAYRLEDGSAVFLGQLFVDADGAAKAYHKDDAKALDNLVNAGVPGNWWALATDAPDCGPSGEPLVQKAGDPAPGNYVAMTSMVNPSVNDCSKPANYVNAETIPYVALSKKIRVFDYANNEGALALVLNTQNGKQAFAVFADQAPDYGFGEGSIYLNTLLGHNPDPKSGGTDVRQNVVLVFKDEMGFPANAAAVDAAAAKAFAAWGGEKRLKECSVALAAAPK
jgi:Fungal chitosanase of glycosyl hydrolase group 75